MEDLLLRLGFPPIKFASARCRRSLAADIVADTFRRLLRVALSRTGPKFDVMDEALFILRRFVVMVERNGDRLGFCICVNVGDGDR